MALIELTDIRKSYRLGMTEVNALSDINLKIEKGEFASLWGPSGSGKTSLLNLMGLIDRPSCGNVRIMDKKVDGEKDHELAQIRNRNIGFIFQTFNLLDVLDALENIMLPLQIQRVQDNQAKSRAMKVLEEVGLAHLANHRPTEMSGGQQQRVAIARALVTNPAIILADEPTANLDSKTGEHIINLMRELNEKSQITFIFSTHDHHLVNSSKRKINILDGRIVEDSFNYEH